MEKPEKDRSHRRLAVAFTLLLILIFEIYSNTFHASWHLDDYHNIVTNPRLKINDLSPESVIQTFFSHYNRGMYQSEKLYRPVACLTFGLNWYFGGSAVGGYHFVNIMIHFLTAAVLFLTILNLLRTPNLYGKYPGNEYAIALLAAALWAVNPVHTQAVNYIVQRMASLAALFYLLALYLYIKGRLEDTGLTRKTVWFSLAGVSFLLAVGSKENALLWPAAVVLTEVIFFQDLSRPRTRKRFLILLAASVAFVLCLGLIIFFKGGFGFLKGFANRPFTMIQRLLTEFRILIYYLSQLAYPIPSRLSIAHDVQVSTSLFQPWTTLPSILMVLSLIVWSALSLHKRPVVSFALLFYFLNHIIESSIIPLELVFEHRVYLTSLFLFFPIAIWILQLLGYYQRKNKRMHAVLACFVTLLLIGLGSGTFIRNIVWATEKSLWEDALAKAPDSSRPYHNLAWAHYEKQGQLEKAIALYRESLQRTHHNLYDNQLALNNIANLHYRQRDYKRATQLWEQALAIFPGNEAIRYRMALGYTKKGDLDVALGHIDKLVSKRQNHPDYLHQKGYLLLKLKRYQEALVYLKKCLKLSPSHKKAVVNRGACLNQMREYRSADWALRYAHAHYPRNAITVLWLIDTNLKTADRVDTDHYLKRLFALLDVNELVSLLENRPETNFMLFPNSKVLYQKIAAVLRERSAAIAHRESQTAETAQ